MRLLLQGTLPPDMNFLAGQVIPLIGAVVALIVGGVVVKSLFRSPVGEAIAERIRAGMLRRKHWKGVGGEWTDAPAEGLADDRRVAALEQHVHALEGQLTELAERVDFAERLLAERRERKLGAGQ
jgi:hypothetical protein